MIVKKRFIKQKSRHYIDIIAYQRSKNQVHNFGDVKRNYRMVQYFELSSPPPFPSVIIRHL